MRLMDDNKCVQGVNMGHLFDEIDMLAKAGVDVDALAAQLQAEGAKSFVDSWKDLLRVIESKSAVLKKTA